MGVKPYLIRSANGGIANSGVPAKTIFSGIPLFRENFAGNLT